ncbi:hypothetical protein EsDP_00004479 [Epichloe bromicola]|uniref:Cdc23 domain-containing protein n=1 Tax=Epichloe bromicola TaxID=79588 RepID=A0ABQ0CRU4_9HYPO
MSLDQVQINQLQGSLQRSVLDCSERCLYQAAKWAAELLNALPDHGIDEPSSHSLLNLILTTGTLEQRLELKEVPKYLKAKALFDCHEFQRSAAVFLPSSFSELPTQASLGKARPNKRNASAFTRNRVSQKGLFIALYAQFMVGEKLKTEELGQILGISDVGTIVNKQLVPIKRALESRLARIPIRIDFSERRNNDLAIHWLLRSVSLNPWNWGAWEELSDLIRAVRHLERIQCRLSPSIMGFIFSIYCRQRLQQGSPSLLAELSQLQSIFPGSLFLRGQRALVTYQLKDVYEANSIFWAMTLSDPRRLDFVDHYSNLLHTLASQERLAFVAQLCSAVDRYRPETCCVKSSGSRSPFLRRMDIAGSRVTELQNMHAAAECYRRAIDLNQHDYRSFVGLGRAYETLDKATFALYYYRRAVKLRPMDADLWQLVANCLIGLSLLPEAAKVLERALTYLGPSTNTKYGSSSFDHSMRKRLEVLYQLAKIYDETENRDEATRLLELCVEEYSAFQERSDADDSMTAILGRLIIPKALLLLAEWAIGDGDFLKAQAMASRIDIDCELAADAQKILEICTCRDGSSIHH